MQRNKPLTTIRQPFISFCYHNHALFLEALSCIINICFIYQVDGRVGLDEGQKSILSLEDEFQNLFLFFQAISTPVFCSHYRVSFKPSFFPIQYFFPSLVSSFSIFLLNLVSFTSIRPPAPLFIVPLSLPTYFFPCHG